MSEEGEDMKIKPVSFRLPELLAHRLSARARKENLTPDQLVRKIVEAYLDSGSTGLPPDIHANRRELPGIMEKMEKAKRALEDKKPKKGPSTLPS